MRTIILFSLCLMISGLGFAQQPENVEKGDTFTLKSSSNVKFQSLKLPKLNFLVKQGERPNYKKLNGLEVEVVSLEETKKGTYAVLKRTDDKDFFIHRKTLKANLEKAFSYGELE
ncbi:hypothetical protein [Zunongwangia sp. HRR-M8]|uniref:hypothetical protein n=1 Tax=Zunongwangia sp. HRR-M8 TaxID=3015170 RepID=UPI0022DD4D15|nr:hypothetical protein [Zunongwangia sp. HRR-M8]WBL21406.1 hypothetical protein PBT89_11735 [Zunongwangia sp. HRR-M8]